MIKIEQAASGDLDDLVDLERSGFSEAEQWSENNWQQELTGECRLVLVARDADGSPAIGAITLSVTDTTADLLRIVVAQSRRRTGIGRQLIDAAIDAVRESGVKTIMLEVRMDNESAIGLYQAIGFEQLGARNHYYGPDQHALIMKLYDLTPGGPQAGIGRHTTGQDPHDCADTVRTGLPSDAPASLSTGKSTNGGELP